MRHAPGSFYKLTIGALVACLLVFLLSFIFLFRTNRSTLTDSAWLGGDTLAYQSLGVNLAYGYGYRIGGILDFDTYKFEKNKNDYNSICYWTSTPETYLNHFIETKGAYIFNRAPGYPFFIALVYKLFGVHPYMVKLIQMILLALALSLIPIIGMCYWGKTGIFSGLVSTVIYLRYFYLSPTVIMTEPLIMASCFMWVIFLMIWESKPSTAKTLAMGIASATIVLIKPVTIFIPALFLLYIIFASNRVRDELKMGVVFILSFFLCIIPWSIYATQKSGNFVFISTMGPQILLASNNEDTLDTGGWSLLWATKNSADNRYLYNRLKNSGYSSIRKYLIFMNENKEHMPRFMKNKLKAALPPGKSHKLEIILMGMGFYYLLNIFLSIYAAATKRFVGNDKIAIFPSIFFLNVLLITIIFYGLNRFIQPFMPFFILPAVHVSFQGVKLLINNINRRQV